MTKERYIKAFDPAVLAAMESLETSLDALNNCSATVQQVNWISCGKLLKPNCGEVAERLKAAVC